jgi:hypothetical protein
MLLNSGCSAPTVLLILSNGELREHDLLLARLFRWCPPEYQQP